MAKKTTAKRKTTVKKAAKKAARKPGTLKPRSGAPAAVRSDLNKPGEVAIDRMPEPQRGIARAVDMAIRSAVPGATSVVKWGNACYYVNDRAFAALMATRLGINLALPGTKIPDPEKLLQGTGKTMRHVKLADTKLAKSEAVRKLIVAAAEVGLDGM